MCIVGKLAERRAIVRQLSYESQDWLSEPLIILARVLPYSARRAAPESISDTLRDSVGGLNSWPCRRRQDARRNRLPQGMSLSSFRNADLRLFHLRSAFFGDRYGLLMSSARGHTQTTGLVEAPPSRLAEHTLRRHFQRVDPAAHRIASHHPGVVGLQHFRKRIHISHSRIEPQIIIG